MRTGIKAMAGVMIASAVGMTAIAARADNKQEDQKFCADVTALNTHLSSLEKLGKQSTVNEVRSTTGHVEADAKDMQKDSQKMTSPAAQQLDKAVSELQREVGSVSTAADLAKARDKIQADARGALNAGKQVAAVSRCSG